MKDSKLRHALQQRRLVCDGAMGTQLMLAGLEAGSCGEMWNLTHPERVLAIQSRYAAAGADCAFPHCTGTVTVALGIHATVTRAELVAWWRGAIGELEAVGVHDYEVVR